MVDGEESRVDFVGIDALLSRSAENSVVAACLRVQRAAEAPDSSLGILDDVTLAPEVDCKVAPPIVLSSCAVDFEEPHLTVHRSAKKRSLLIGSQSRVCFKESNAVSIVSCTSRT